MNILIANATGKVGQEVVHACDQLKLSARLGAHTLKKARQLFPKHDIAAFDFTDAAGMRTALKGIEAVFCATPYEIMPDAEKRLIDLAKECGVKRFVKLSVLLADRLQKSFHGGLERYLQQSGMEWTVLRSNWFMQNYVTYFIEPIRDLGKIIEPAAMGKTSFIDTRDVGAVAAVVLSDGKHNGKIYELTGGQAIDRAIVAKYISVVSGRSIDYVPVDDASFRQAWSMAPAHLVDYISELYGFTRDGDTARITTDVRSLTGRDPISFENFARDHATGWAPQGFDGARRVA